MTVGREKSELQKRAERERERERHERNHHTMNIADSIGMEEVKDGIFFFHFTTNFF